MRGLLIHGHAVVLFAGLSHRLIARVSCASLVSALGCLPQEDLSGYARDRQALPDSSAPIEAADADADAAAGSDAEAGAHADAATSVDAGLLDAAGASGVGDGGSADAAAASGLRSTDAAVASTNARDAQP